MVSSPSSAATSSSSESSTPSPIWSSASPNQISASKVVEGGDYSLGEEKETDVDFQKHLQYLCTANGIPQNDPARFAKVEKT